MDVVRYLTHPQVQIDPSIPVPEWGLSELGRLRVERLVAAGWLGGTRLVVSSAERKAIETADPIAAALGSALEVRPSMHENDRSATGFLPPAEFERVADRFFAEPHTSVRGWERAIDAQSRIAGEALEAVAKAPPGDVLLVGHGAVGTLLFCQLSGQTIDRRHDQPNGGGHYFSFLRNSLSVLHGWRPMEIPPSR